MTGSNERRARRGLRWSWLAQARARRRPLLVAWPISSRSATFRPSDVLALTFSNRAAGEMRERLVGSGLPGERMPIMTIHAFAATLLREYHSRVPHAPDEAELKPDFRILDEANAYLLMEELLGELPLHYYRSLGNPTAHLRTLLADFSHARDELLTPTDYLALVEKMPLAPVPDEAQRRLRYPARRPEQRRGSAKRRSHQRAHSPTSRSSGRASGPRRTRSGFGRCGGAGWWILAA